MAKRKSKTRHHRKGPPRASQSVPHNTTDTLDTSQIQDASMPIHERLYKKIYISDNMMWFLFGGGALTSILVAIVNLFMNIHPIEHPEEPYILSALVQSTIILVFIKYYYNHHSQIKIRYKNFREDLKKYKLNRDLIVSFAAATAYRVIAPDIAKHIEGRQIITSTYFYVLNIIIMVICILYLSSRLYKNRRYVDNDSFDLPNINYLNMQKSVVVKLNNLSKKEVEELSMLVYKNTRLSAFGFKDILSIIWGSIVIAFFIQLMQTVVGLL